MGQITGIRRYAALLLAVSLVFVPLTRARALEILTSPIEQLLDEKGNGPFADMIRDIDARIDDEITLTILPWKRKSAFWQDGKGDAFFPAIHWWAEQQGHLSTEPVYYKRMHAFMPKGITQPANYLALKNRRLATILGYSFPPFIAENDIRFANRVVNEAAALNMVAMGRSDAAVLELRSGMAAMGRLSLDERVSVDAAKALWIEKIGFALRDTEQGRALQQKLDRAIRAIIADGDMPWLRPENH